MWNGIFGKKMCYTSVSFQFCFAILVFKNISVGFVQLSDLATRNCLITKDLEVKITDFGLGRQLDDPAAIYEPNYLPPIPYRWSAPVSVFTQFFPNFFNLIA